MPIKPGIYLVFREATDHHHQDMAEKVETMRESVETEGEELEKKNDQMKERKVSWAKLRRVDSLNLEAGRVSMTHSHGSQVS